MSDSGVGEVSQDVCGGRVPLVSIIVPCYNVADQVDACLSSLLKQEGTVPYEVVCVNDGSTDGTASALAAYAGDSRVHIVNRPNGGLSAARNTGVEAASGAYISFVDGDDFVSPYYVSSLTVAMEGEKGRMVSGALLPVSPQATAHSVDWAEPHSSGAYCGADAFDLVCRDVVTESACAKLFPAWICKKTPFPEGEFYEDLSVMGERLVQLEDLVLLDAPIYGYRMREGSIVRSTSASMGQAEDYERALQRFSRVATAQYPQCEQAMLFRTLLTYARMRALLLVVRDDREAARAKLREISAFARAHVIGIIQDQGMSFSSKIRFVLLGFAPGVHDMLLAVHGRIARRGDCVSEEVK